MDNINAGTKLLNPSDEEAQMILLNGGVEKKENHEELPITTTKKLGVGKYVWKRIILLMKAGYRHPFSLVANLSYLLLGIAVLTNLTQQWFVSLPSQFQKSLQKEDEPKFRAELWFCLLYVSILFIGNGTFKLVAGIVRAKLREKITETLHAICLNNNVYYRTVVLEKLVDNPDERIVRDVDNWTQNWMSILCKFVNCSLSVALMTGVNFGSMGVLALVPTGVLLVSSFVSVLLVRRVIPRVFRQQLLEGDFRFAHMRVRENVESLAFCGPQAERKELNFLDNALHRAIVNRISVYVGYYGMDLINELLKYGGKMLGFIVVGISFFYGNGKGMAIGDLLTSVFATENLMMNLQEIVQLVENFGDVAGYTARAGEVLELDRLNKESNMDKPNTTSDGGYSLSNASITAPNGRTLFKNLSLELAEGAKMIIKGANGCGKTSLFRALAGIWPCSEGSIARPEDAYFLPQKPFLSQATGITLRDLVSYPDVLPSPHTTDDMHLHKAMKSVGLSELVKWRSLDETDNWEAILSPGEKQGIVFARMLFHHPRHALLDESTSAMSKENEELCFNAMKEKNISFVTISHDGAVIKHHEYMLEIREDMTWNFGKIERKFCV